MQFKPLGRTGMTVSEICLGTMTWGSQNTLDEAHAQLDYAIGEGVNFIDTAEMYPTTPRRAETTGLTEEIVGAWLKGRSDRDSLVVATKITGEGNRDVREGKRVDGAMLRAALDDSLMRLKTDRIDLYQLHWPNRGSYHFRKYWKYDPADLNSGDMDQEVADLLGAVSRLQDEGKLRAFGLSNETAWGTMKFLEASRRYDLPRVVSVQNEYSLLCRLYDLDMAEVGIQEDVGLMAFSPLAAGAMSGKYMAQPGADGARLLPVALVHDQRHHRRDVDGAAQDRYCREGCETGRSGTLRHRDSLPRPSPSYVVIKASKAARPSRVEAFKTAAGPI
jgi:aryl-alcohol dehydrogenase-like predicted oxidoreductase